MALTDIHNAGSIFGIIYRQILTFTDAGQVTLTNDIEITRAGLIEWKENLENEKWIGTYKFDSDDKHVKCILTNYKNNIKKEIYAAFATDSLLICEVYTGGSNKGQGQVFEKINASI
ncbi:hypothetical protein [Pontibacter sp. HSC-36F09]|uniref:hypothetical protein n=1 Tax=Pontibacter sp. HSC-36F09 TaxID=2910966 RepID=UPI0020A06489|nr:hypothetical protein [Pontibacter sp. HSC-36F09]MCP2045815.1 hypothetical protein [Pontibacter sp. HSC-36F09]